MCVGVVRAGVSDVSEFAGMPLLLRAIITGFGYKLGAELGRYVAEKIGLKKPDNDGELPDGLIATSPLNDDEDGGDDGDDDDGEQQTH
jgi:hypothetical protein